MDLSFFKQESEQTKATNSAKSQSHQFSIPPLSGMPSASMAPVFDTAADSQFERPPPSFPPVEAFIPQSEPPKQTFSAPPQRVEPRTVQAAASVPSAAGAAAPPQNSVPPPRLSGHSRLPLNGIEPAAPTNEPFDIEDVMVSTKYLQSPAQVHGGEYRSGSSAQTQTVKVVERVGLSRQEVEKIVEETLAVAVDRAVRQALTEVIPDLRQTLVIEVSQRAVDQLSEELMVIKKTLREQMVAEIRDVSSQWLRKETPSIAKDVIREEIRRVIEQI
jgi:cell pole-organizing protein PopZ